MKEFNEFKQWINEADNPLGAAQASPLSSPAVDEPDNVKDTDEVDKDTDTSGEASPLSILSEDNEKVILCPYCSSEEVEILHDFSATSMDEPQYQCDDCGETFYEDDVDNAYGLQEDDDDEGEAGVPLPDEIELSKHEQMKKDKKFRQSVKKFERSKTKPSWYKDNIKESITELDQILKLSGKKVITEAKSTRALENKKPKQFKSPPPYYD